MNKKLYLSSWVNFGKYRKNPNTLQNILDTREGRSWVKWLVENSTMMEVDKSVTEYIKSKEDGRVLQPA